VILGGWREEGGGESRGMESQGGWRVEGCREEGGSEWRGV